MLCSDKRALYLKERKPNWISIGVAMAFVALIFGLLGGISSRYFGPETEKLTYAEFVSIILSAISILLTILGIIIAIVALFGWQAISKKVESRADEALIKYLKDDMLPEDKVFELLLERVQQTLSVSKDEEDMILDGKIDKSGNKNDN